MFSHSRGGSPYSPYHQNGSEALLNRLTKENPGKWYLGEKLGVFWVGCQFSLALNLSVLLLRLVDFLGVQGMA